MGRRIALYGPIGQHLDDQQESLPSPLFMGWKPSFQLKWACLPSKQSCKIKGTTMKNSKGNWIGLTKSKKRKVAAIRITSYHQMVISQYNKKAWPLFFFFLLGSLVLKRVFENIAELGARKLQVNWEGPYIVIKAGDLGTYHLQTLDGVPLFCHWNLTNLKQYYQ